MIYSTKVNHYTNDAVTINASQCKGQREIKLGHTKIALLLSANFIYIMTTSDPPPWGGIWNL
jgi:hypothetical protein